MVSAWIDLGLGLSIDESFEMQMHVFQHFYRITDEHKSALNGEVCSKFHLLSCKPQPR